MKVPLIAIASLTAMLLPAAGFAQDVTGTFVVTGASTSFRYVYAFWKDQAPFKEGLLNLYVLLSDVPVAENALPRDDRANQKMAELVRNNKIHAFELHFADPGKTLDMGENGAVYHNGIQPARFGVTGFFHYQMLKFDGRSLEGKVWMDPDEVAPAGFKVDATFKVSIPPHP